MKNYTIEDAYVILNEYNNLFKTSKSLAGFVAGESLDNECDKMCKEIDSYHQAIMDNFPDDECNRR